MNQTDEQQRVIVGHPHDHCAECCADPTCARCWPATDLYPADPDATAHEMGAGCWCGPSVQVVHRLPARP